MWALRCVLATITFVVGISLIQAAKIPADEVEPFPETEPTTEDYKLALKFKPQLAITIGCQPYAAVNANGDISQGLKLINSKGDMGEGSLLGSQVYGRLTMYEDKIAIMYAWYFPRLGFVRHSWDHAIIWLDSDNSTISAVTSWEASLISSKYRTVSPPGSGMLDGFSVKLRYFGSGQTHSIKCTKRPGDFQDLVMWDDMTDAAREALSTTTFGWGLERTQAVPFIDTNFASRLKKAYPWLTPDIL